MFILVKMLKSYGRLSLRTMREDVANERYHVLLDKLNSFKQLDDENAESMYSRLNTLVNEINSLGVKQIEDLELIRKILHSLRRPEYDLVTTILHEK